MIKIAFTTKAMIHSLHALDEVTIETKVGDNQYLARYKDKLYTAIFNPFTCLYYVDDIYGLSDIHSANNL